MNNFFTFKQNNSGGHFHEPAVYLYVEADDKDKAIELVSNHITLCGDSGMYAEYDNCGCCPCCGHRWSDPWEDEPQAKGKVFVYNPGMTYMGETAHALVRADGTLVVGDTREAYELIANYVGFEPKQA